MIWRKNICYISRPLFLRENMIWTRVSATFLEICILNSQTKIIDCGPTYRCFSLSGWNHHGMRIGLIIV